MLLNKRCRDADIQDDGATTASSGSSKETALRFIEAVSNTKSLNRPKYIDIASSTPTAVTEGHC